MECQAYNTSNDSDVVETVTSKTETLLKQKNLNLSKILRPECPRSRLKA